MIFPWHFAEDRALDSSTSDGENIGTTLRGIGPCYRDKVGRSFAIRLGDLYRPNFRERVEHVTRAKNVALAAMMPRDQFVPLNAADDLRRVHGLCRAAEAVRGRHDAYLLDAAEAGKRMLFEGAQGALLDVDHGTFPFVTSSNSSGVGVSSGSGVPGRYIDQGHRHRQGL